jgi:hypothetical protein
MKKLILLLSMALMGTLIAQAQQGPELYKSSMKKDVQSYANDAAYDLNKCCSSMGGNNLTADVHWNEKDDDGKYITKYNGKANLLNIAMTISWTGSITGKKFWIKGKLTVDTDTGARSWRKESDSGGFKPNCSNGCIN